MSPLGWGRRYLMCPPEHFDVLYAINPWMHREVRVNPGKARAQWEALVTILKQAGAEVEIIDAVPGFPDMVFTANAGVLNGKRFVPSRFFHPERSGESEKFAGWFADHGFSVHMLEEGLHLEGAGDALCFGDALVAGYRIRSDFAAHLQLSSMLNTEVLSVELVDPRFYHMDLTFCPLSDRCAIIYPDGWDRYGRKVMEALVPHPVVIDTAEAENFCANSVVVGNLIVMPHCTPRLGRILESIGLDVAVVPVTEFEKAGGGVRCMTLALDVTLDPAKSP